MFFLHDETRMSIFYISVRQESNTFAPATIANKDIRTTNTSKIMEQRFCQSCGMPLTEDVLGINADGTKNEDYCIYCYKDGAFTGDFTMEQMVEYCSMFVEEYNKNTGQHLTACQYKDVLRQFYPTLKRWKGDDANIPHADHPMKKVFIEEVNALGISGLHVDNLYVLQGSFINQAYDINGNEVKLLDDNAIYWGNQVMAPHSGTGSESLGSTSDESDRCYGIACCEKFILVSEYGKDGADAEVVMLKRRC